MSILSTTSTLSRSQVAKVYDQVKERKKSEGNAEELKNLEKYSSLVDNYFRSQKADTMTISESRIAKLTQDNQEEATYMGPRDRFINRFRAVDKKQELELLFAIIQADSNDIVKLDDKEKSIPSQVKKFNAFVKLRDLASSDAYDITTQVEEHGGLFTKLNFTINSVWQSLWRAGGIECKEAQISDKFSTKYVSPLIGTFLDSSNGGQLIQGTKSEIVELSTQACYANAVYLETKAEGGSNSALQSAPKIIANNADLGLAIFLDEQVTERINKQRNEYASCIFKSLNKNVEFKDLFVNNSKRMADGFIEINTILEVETLNKDAKKSATDKEKVNKYTVKYTEIFHANSGEFVSTTQPKVEKFIDQKKPKQQTAQAQKNQLDQPKENNSKLIKPSEEIKVNKAQNNYEAQFVYSNLLNLKYEGKIFLNHWLEIVTQYAEKNITKFEYFKTSLDICTNVPENLYLLFFLKQKPELFNFLKSLQLDDSSIVSQLAKCIRNKFDFVLITNLHKQICFLEKYNCLLTLKNKATNILLEKMKTHDNVNDYLPEFLTLLNLISPKGIPSLNFKQLAAECTDESDIHKIGSIPQKYIAPQPIRMDNNVDEIDPRSIKGNVREVDEKDHLTPVWQNYVMKHYQSEYIDASLNNKQEGIWSNGQHCLAHEIRQQCWGTAKFVEEKLMTDFMSSNSCISIEAGNIIKNINLIKEIPCTNSYLELLEEKYLKNKFKYYNSATKNDEILDDDKVREVFTEFKYGSLAIA